MLLTKEVEVTVTAPTYKHYMNKGYFINGVIKNEKFVFKRGQKIVVDVNDLPLNSREIVLYRCDNCGKQGQNTWRDFKKYLKNNDSYCNKCSMTLYGTENSRKSRLIKNRNSFYSFCMENEFEDVLNRWDYSKNQISPHDVSKTSHKKFWFLCEKNIHDSEKKSLTIFSLKKMRGCISCDKCNSLGYIYPESLNLWSDKNTKSPMEYSKSSASKVWWKCNIGKHFDYCRSINVSEQCFFRCPKCSDEREESYLQEKVKKYFVENGYNILTENSCNLVCKNPKTGRSLPYDNEITSLNLVIEVHGEQHYDMRYLKTMSKLSGNKLVEAFEYQQWKDQYKREYALSQGYSYLEIPYWTNDSQETYKQLINDKIDEILNNNNNNNKYNYNNY